MKVALVVGEHGARVEGEESLRVAELASELLASSLTSAESARVRETHIGETSQFHVDLGELGPGDELGRGAVDGLLCELERPVVLVFCSEEVALDVEERVGLWVVLESGL
jgi:hypothetical protein